MSETKKCPHCEGVIKAAAIKCKHCESMLDEVANNEKKNAPTVKG